MPVPIRNWISWLVGGLLLCAMGFHNTYPLFYPDTGTYIECGFRGEQWIYGRAMAYALFLRHASLASSLWYAMIAQGLLLSSAMLLALRHFLPERVRPHADLIHVGLTLFLVLCTGVSVRCSQLLPDIFTPMAALGMAIVLFARKLSWPERIYLSLLTIWALVSHPSNLASFLLLLGGLSLWWGILWLRTKQLVVKPAQWIWGLLLLASSWILTPTLNYVHGAHFRITESSPIFFMGKLNYTGILPLFLRDECKDDSTYLFCDFKESMPFEFLWDPKSPLNKGGLWKRADHEAFQELTSTILGKPKYFKMYVEAVILGSIKQFFNFETANIYVVKSQGTPYLFGRFYHEDRIYRNSKQWKGTLDIDHLNRRQEWIVYLSFFIVLGLIVRPTWRTRLSPEMQWLIVFVVGLLITNAGVCGGLSNGTMRYQNRIIWLLPFILAIPAMVPLQQLWIRIQSWWRAVDQA